LSMGVGFILRASKRRQFFQREMSLAYAIAVKSLNSVV